MATNTHPFVLRIRRARAAITTAEQALITARDRGNAGEVGRLERDLESRRAYLDGLQAARRALPRP
jgi:hypothetical protein